MKRIFLSLIFIMIALAGVSCASASSDFNDTAVEFDHDIAPVNDDFEDVIVNNVSVDDDADVSNVIANDVALNNQYMTFINPLTQQSNHQYIELTRLNSTILHFGHNDIVIHAVKLRVLDSSYRYPVANVPVAFNTHYSNDSSSEKMLNLYKNKPLDTYTTFDVTDEDGYVVFTYVVNPDPNIYACCWFEPAEVQYKLCPVTVPAAIWQSKNNMVFSINPDNTSFSIDIWKDNINGDFNVIWTILQF